jgi:hypothetical protein
MAACAQKKTHRKFRWVDEINKIRAARAAPSLLPSALLVAIRLQALPALVFIHLQTTFLFQIAHVGLFGERSTCDAVSPL